MRAGTLRHPVIIQAATDGRTATGSPSRTWNTWAEAFVSVRPLSGQELQDAQALEERITHEVRMRWIEGVTAKMRIVLDERTLEIVTAPSKDERRRELVIQAREVT